MFWASNPPKSGLQSHFECSSALLDGYRYAGRFGVVGGCLIVSADQMRLKLDRAVD